jgi:cellulase
MDIWEANSLANAMTPHTCSSSGSFLCSGTECNGTTASVCDKNGCGLNPFRTGAKDFYGPGMTVDTTRPFTVVTQFVGTGGNSSSSNSSAGDGTLSEIRRLYVQDGVAIQNAPVTGSSSGGTAAAEAGAISEEFCTAANSSSFLRLGGLQAMGESLDRGMVLVFSLWNSAGDFMNWLDSGEAGPCNSTAGNPALIAANDPGVSVTFSNIRWGDIGSTFNASGASKAAVVGAGQQAQQEAAAAATGTVSSALSAHAAVPAAAWMVMVGVMGYLML